MASQHIDPYHILLKRCSINGIDYTEGTFHVKEFRIFEDICKSYFTGQLVVETTLNIGDSILQPTVPVVISYIAKRSDNGPSKTYTESFRIYSYDSKQIGAGAAGRVEHTLALIGQEYYNDRHNTVIINVANRSGTAAARQIHDKYIATNGPLAIPAESMGLIGQQYKPHEVRNKKPVKAIFDILDRCVYAEYPTCAPTYFRNKNGYVIAPLQMLLETSPINSESFVHSPGQGSSFAQQRLGYNIIGRFVPVSPAGEDNSGISVGDLSKLITTTAFFDSKTGNYQQKFPAAAAVTGMSSKIWTKSPHWKKNIDSLIASTTRGRQGARVLFNMIDELMQSRSVDKFGPGDFNKQQEAFLTTLNYAQKYRLSVPAQSGLNVTCGTRIHIIYPINTRVENKVLFVPRLIHEVKFTDGEKRNPTQVGQGTTEFYGVLW